MTDEKRYTSPGFILQLLIVIVVIPLLPMLISGRWNWWEAWAYAAVHILGFVLSRVLAARQHPDLLEERARMTDHEDTEPWDRTLAPLMALGIAVVLLVAGLEARLIGLSTFSLAVRLAALAVMLAGYALGTYALIANRFFSGVVRIQSDRGHMVVSTGPYRWLRHPGYAGALLSYVVTPVLLNTPWAFLPVALLGIVTVLRTSLEDQTLKDKLAGYREYAERVRYRLIPGIW